MYVNDPPRMLDFYTTVLGMTVTDRTDERVYLSAQPDREHHQLLFDRSSDQKTQAGQISLHVASLQDLKDLYQQVRPYGCTFDMIVNHGIAFGCYFFDPEDIESKRTGPRASIIRNRRPIGLIWRRQMKCC